MVSNVRTASALPATAPAMGNANASIPPHADAGLTNRTGGPQTLSRPMDLAPTAPREGGQPPRTALAPKSAALKAPAPQAGPAASEAKTLVQTLLPRLFGDNSATAPSPTALNDLQGALDGLRGACAAAGAPEAVKPLLEALARLGELPAFTARAKTPEDRDAAVAMLQAHVESAAQAIGPGRDGAALTCLYGHSAKLDDAIDTLRTDATKHLLSSQVDAGTAAQLAKDLVQDEHGIAQTRLQIQRLLAKETGFTPPLGSLRFDPALVQGMTRTNPAATRQAGIFIGSLLATQRDLAQSPAAGHLRSALQNLGAGTTPLSRDDAAFVEQRRAALAEQPIATGLSPDDLARLKLGEASDKEVSALLQGLATRGLAGVGEVRHLLATADRTLGRVKRGHKHLDKLDAKHQLNLDIVRGNALATGLLCQATGNADLDTTSSSQVRAALTGPNAPLAPLSLQQGTAPAAGSLRHNIMMPGARHLELTRLEADIEGDLQKLAKAADHGQPNPTRQDELQQSLERIQKEKEDLLSSRKEAMGPDVATALDHALHAASLLSRPEELKVPPTGADQPHGVKRTLAKLSQDAKIKILGQSIDSIHAQRMDRLLQKWGLDPAAVMPEANRRLQEPIDATHLHDAFAAFAPTGAVNDRWTRELATLNERLSFDGDAHIDKASLAHFFEAVGELKPGMYAAWKLEKGIGIAGSVPVSGTVMTGASVDINAELDRSAQLVASRDAEGHQLLIGSALGGKIGAELAAELLGLGSCFSLGAAAGMHASGSRLDGVALRFPDTEAGRADMGKLLERLTKQGSLKPTDLLSAEQIMSEKARAGGIGVNASTGLKADIPVPAALSNYVSAAPKLSVGAGIDGLLQVTTQGNAHRADRTKEKAFTFEVPATLAASVSVQAGFIPTIPLLGSVSENIPIPDLSASAKFTCTTATHDVMRDDQVAAGAEHSTKISGPAALMPLAVYHLGGKQLQAVARHLKDSTDPTQRAQFERLDALIRGATSHDSIKVVWRIAPEARQKANGLLERARAASSGAGGRKPTAADLKQAEQLQEQAQALLDDSANYRLHGLEKHSSAESSAALGMLNNQDLSAVKWSKTANVRMDRKRDSIEFDPALVDAALQAGTPQPAARP